MSADKILTKKCEALTYSKVVILDESVFATTKNEMRELYEEYGFANVLGVLFKLWDFDKAIPFFDKMRLQVQSKKQIKTIAVFYCRAYNGGIERVNAQLVNLWLEMGFKVVFITEEEPNNLDYYYPKDKVKRIIVPNYSEMSARLNALQKIVTEEQIDVFINHAWTYPSVLWECVLMKNLKIPYVIYTHGFFPGFYSSPFALYYQIFRMVDLVITLSETNAKFYQMCGCRVCLIHNPVSKELKDVTQTAGLDSHHIVWAGRFIEGKRPLDSIRIFKKVREQIPDAVLDIVGGADPWWLERMLALSRELGVFDAIRFHGLQSEDKMRDFYMNSSLLLFTSEREGFSMTLQESKAFGLPCVMYSLPYLSLVKDGKGFLSAEIGDIDAMADNVIRLLKDDVLRKSLGREARESFNTFANYDLCRNWQKIFDFCEGKSLKDEIFYTPDKLEVVDKYILPPMFDILQTSYTTFANKSLDYKVGHKLLKYPRKIVGIIKKILMSEK